MQTEHKEWCDAVNTVDGARVQADENGYVSLGIGTYVVMVGSRDCSNIAVEVQTDATIVATAISLECTGAPHPSTKEPGAITDWTVAADSAWVKDDSATNAILMSNGTGWTATILTMAKTAGVGCAIWQLGCRAAPRYRCRFVVTTAGKVRVNWHCKT
jgi:hypothetical protein